MRFTIAVRNREGGEIWTEDYDKPKVRTEADANKFGADVVAYWNSTLRPGEKEREFIAGSGKLIAVSQVAGREHDWEKQNLFTEIKRGQIYDRMKCRHCPVTAKRFGLMEAVVIDSKFRAKKYQHCVGAA